MALAVPALVAAVRLGATVTGASAAEAGTPDTPSVFLAVSSDTGTPEDMTTSETAPELVVTAPAAGTDYTVALRMDAADAAFATRVVQRGRGVGFAVRAPTLVDGVHHVHVTAHSPQGRSAVGSLELTVRTGTVGGERVIVHGNGDGHAAAGESVGIVFDRPLRARSVCPLWEDDQDDGAALSRTVTAVLTPGVSGDGATLAVAPSPGAPGGPVVPVAFGRVTVAGHLPDHRAVRFTGSTLVLSADRRGLTLVLGRPDRSGVARGARPGTIRPVYLPAAPAPTDRAGNPVDPVGFADVGRSGF